MSIRREFLPERHRRRIAYGRRRRRRFQARGLRSDGVPYMLHREYALENEEMHSCLVELLNSLVRYPHEQGMAKIDGAIACPNCGRWVITHADPCEWSRGLHPVWRRRRRQGNRPAWSVTDYWGGVAECCNLLLAFQPDGSAEAYSLNI